MNNLTTASFYTALQAIILTPPNTGKQKIGQAKRQTGKETDRQGDRQTKRQTGKEIDREIKLDVFMTNGASINYISK